MNVQVASAGGSGNSLTIVLQPSVLVTDKALTNWTLRDLGPLAKVTRLMTLNLNDNQVSDLAPLAKQTELNLLMLERNKVSDLTPLVNAAKADAEGQRRFAPFLRLYMAGNPLSEAARTTQLKALASYGVRVLSS